MKKIAANKAFRTVVHVATATSALIAAYGGIVPDKYAVGVAAVSGVLSSFLHVVNAYFPAEAPAK